jgi:hypothetical protein
MLTWHCQTKTLAKLDAQVQHLQGDIDYSIPHLQQQILDLNALSEWLLDDSKPPRRIKIETCLTRRRLLVADLLQQNEYLLRQNEYLLRQNARMSQEVETCK